MMTDEEFGHVERLSKLRRTALDACDALSTEPDALTDAYADGFTAALKLVKQDASTFAKAGRPRGMTLPGPGFEAQGAPPGETQVHERSARVALELRRELKLPARCGTVQEEATQLVVKEEPSGVETVVVGRDRSNSFSCVVRLGVDRAVQDAFVLRADEDPGKNFCNRISRFAQWRKATRLLGELLSDGTLSTSADIFKWCERL